MVGGEMERDSGSVDAVDRGSGGAMRVLPQGGIPSMDSALLIIGFLLLLLTPCLVAQRIDLDQEDADYDIPYPDRD